MSEGPSGATWWVLSQYTTERPTACPCAWHRSEWISECPSCAHPLAQIACGGVPTSSAAADDRAHSDGSSCASCFHGMCSSSQTDASDNSEVSQNPVSQQAGQPPLPPLVEDPNPVEEQQLRWIAVPWRGRKWLSFRYPEFCYATDSAYARGLRCADPRAATEAHPQMPPKASRAGTQCSPRILLLDMRRIQRRRHSQMQVLLGMQTLVPSTYPAANPRCSSGFLGLHATLICSMVAVNSGIPVPTRLPPGHSRPPPPICKVAVVWGDTWVHVNLAARYGVE